MSFLRRFEPIYGADRFVRGPLMVVAPHPDDETIGVGGLIAAHRDANVPVTVVVLTDGALGIPGTRAAEDYVMLRERETRAAADALGGFEMRFLRFPDGGLAGAQGVDAAIAEAVSACAPATIAFPSPFEVHPDHGAAAWATLRAARLAGYAGRLLAYEIGAMMPANVLLDITPWKERKARAVAAYASQLVHMDIVGKVEGLNRARTVNVSDPAVRAAEAFADIPPDGIDGYCDAVERLSRDLDRWMPL